MKFRSMCVAAFAGLVTLGLNGGAVAAPEKGTQFQDWTVDCEPTNEGGENSCFILHNVIATKDGEPQAVILQVRVGYWPPNNVLGAIFLVPRNLVYLPPGVQITIDGANVARMPFEVCDSEACVASMALNDGELGKFKAGVKGSAKFQDRGGRDLEVPFSLSGFTAGVSALK